MSLTAMPGGTWLLNERRIVSATESPITRSRRGAGKTGGGAVVAGVVGGSVVVVGGSVATVGGLVGGSVVGAGVVGVVVTGAVRGAAVLAVGTLVRLCWVSLAITLSALAALTGPTVGHASTAAITPTTHTVAPRKRTWIGPRRKRYGRSTRT